MLHADKKHKLLYNEVKSLRNEVKSLRNKSNLQSAYIRKLQQRLINADLKELNDKLRTTKCSNIILSTYPEFASKNVGDAMIADSTLKLLSHHGSTQEYINIFREIDLDKLDLTYVKNILAPGFSVAPNFYPVAFTLFNDLTKMRKFNFIPIGCSHQHPIPHTDSFSPEYYKAKELENLRLIADITGSVPCRDSMIVEMLKSLGIDSHYCGDMVLYDPEKLNHKFTRPNNIQSIAMSVQHRGEYISQSIELLKRITEHFHPDTKIYITLHSAQNSVSNAVKHEATLLGIDCIDLSGTSDNLEFYNDIDIHIGYRLHGHIYFLRNRKPSVLLVEDARAFGFSQTRNINAGCFQALNKDKEPDFSVIDDIFNFIKNEEQNNFSIYDSVFEFIDSTYNEIVSPKIQEIVKTIDS